MNREKADPKRPAPYRNRLRSEIEIFDSKMNLYAVPIRWSFEKLYKVSIPQIIIKIAEKNTKIRVEPSVSKNLKFSMNIWNFQIFLEKFSLKWFKFQKNNVSEHIQLTEGLRRKPGWRFAACMT